MEDEKHYGPGEFDKCILAMADAALTKFPRLTSDDRAAIELGLKQFKRGLALLESDDPELLRDAARRLMWGAYAIGSRANVSDSAIIFRNIERDGAKGRLGAVVRRKRMQLWQEHVRGQMAEILRKNPTLKADDLAERVRSKGSPVALPSYRRLVEFIRGELKAGIAGNRKSLKLVYG
jgi:hypothetical protein